MRAPEHDAQARYAQAPATFRNWAIMVFGPEQGAAMADSQAAALGRALDQAVLYGTQPVQENRMNTEQITEVSATVDTGLSQEDLDGMSEAERLALVVGAAYGKALSERDQARDLTYRLSGNLGQAQGLLEKVLPILEDSSWATDSALADSIQAFLDGLKDVDSDKTPTQEDTPDAT